MSYYLATTEDTVKWYLYDQNDIQPGQFELIDTLDLQVVPACSDKKNAKQVALGLGLKTWRYVKL